MIKKIFLVFFAVISISTGVLAEETDGKKSKAVAITDEIINMRSSLAQAFIKPDMEITEETFKNVCGAVAKRAKEIMEKDGYKIRHASAKNRNPVNAATPEEINILETFDRN